jgi:hypothetical protein
MFNSLLRPIRIQKAVARMLKENDDLLKAMAEYEQNTPDNLTWLEGDIWYGWTYNSDKNRYYFDDIGNESIMGIWQDEFLNQAYERV